MSFSHLLAQIPIFDGFPFDEVDRLLTELEVVRLKPGDILFREGDPSRHLFIVVTGELDIILALGTHKEETVNTLTEGNWLGTFSLFVMDGARSASARAKSEVVLFRMSREQFIQLLKRNPEAALATYRDLTEKERQLQQAYFEKELIEKELKVAAEIQRLILPDGLPSHGKFDFGARILPARQVGGDFYDVFELGNDRVGIVIGDVADKGIPSAIYMARVHALITAEADETLSPGDVLGKVNKHLTYLDKTAQFVTVLYGVLNTESGEFSYARAGHEPPLYLDPEGGVQQLPYKAGMALGLFENSISDENRILLSSNSLLVMYTDGMTDCRNPKGEAFGLRRIMSTMSELTSSLAQASCDALLTRLLDFQNDSKQDDDVTLLAIHAK